MRRSRGLGAGEAGIRTPDFPNPDRRHHRPRPPVSVVAWLGQESPCLGHGISLGISRGHLKQAMRVRFRAGDWGSHKSNRSRITGAGCPHLVKTVIRKSLRSMMPTELAVQDHVFQAMHLYPALYAKRGGCSYFSGSTAAASSLLVPIPLPPWSWVMSSPPQSVDFRQVWTCFSHLLHQTSVCNIVPGGEG